MSSRIITNNRLDCSIVQERSNLTLSACTGTSIGIITIIRILFQSEAVAGRVAVRTEDNKIKVFIETKELEETEQSDIITDDHWKSLHSNQVNDS